MTTTASTSWLRRPRAAVSVMTAAVMVGEKLTMMTASTSAMATRGRPDASASMGSHGHASHAIPNISASGKTTVMNVNRAIGAKRGPSRSTLRVRPAMRAMSVVAMPATTCSCDAIVPVTRLPA